MPRNNADFGYGRGHVPTPEGAPLHDLTQVYPADVYTHPRHYSHDLEMPSHKLALKYQGKPDSMVTIYRAVPKHIDTINPGDWVSIDRNYAKMHAEGNMGDSGKGAKVISMTVPARHIRNPGDSMAEWGYFPD